jgi:hypothetical protein
VPAPLATGCRVTTGRWVDGYTGQIFTDPGKVTIDHVVALKEAWDSGAATWDPARRKAFGNDVADQLALAVVSTSSNSSKGDRDPGEWLPADHARAVAFGHAWLSIKVQWGLTADANEVASLRLLLTGAPTTTAAKPATTVEPTTTAPPVGGSGSVYYANCDAARAAGAAPIRQGQPGYRTALDRDHDGVACEP